MMRHAEVWLRQSAWLGTLPAGHVASTDSLGKAGASDPDFAAASAPNRNGDAESSFEGFAARLRALARFLSGGVHWVWKARLAHTGAKRMRVVETVTLGEKRFAAVLQVDGMQFLIGGGAGTVALLTTLPQIVPQTAAASEAGGPAEIQEGATAAEQRPVECYGCAL
jgi:hypothetical protein